MAHLNILKSSLSSDLKGLIKHITNLEEGTPEFRKNEEFVWNTILHRYYPTVARQKVKTTLDEFIDKFKIHGFPQKARNLKMLIEHYTQLDYFKKFAKTEDFQWGIMLFLIRLSHKPTEQLEDDKPIQFPLVPPVPKEPPFDWAAYLNEDVDKFALPSSGSASSSSWGLSEDEGLFEITSFEDSEDEEEKRKQAEEEEMLKRMKAEKETKEREKEERKLAEMNRLREEERIAQLTQTGWWSDPNFREVPPVNNPHARYCLLWEELLSKDETSGVRVGETKILSEYKVMRELLWIMGHPASSGAFIIKSSSGDFCPRPKTSISSLSPVMFRDLLQGEICPYLKLIAELDNFLDEVHSLSAETPSLPFTLLAYASALLDQLGKFKAQLIELEARVIKQNGKMTMLGLFNEVRPSLRLIRFIHRVHTHAVEPNWAETPNWEVAARLVSVLHFELKRTCHTEKQAVIGLLVRSMRTYLDTIGAWLCETFLHDPKEEFFLMKDEEGRVKVRDYRRVLGSRDSSLLDKLSGITLRAVSSVEFLVQMGSSLAVASSSQSPSLVYESFLEKLEEELVLYCCELQKTEESSAGVEKKDEVAEKEETKEKGKLAELKIKWDFADESYLDEDDLISRAVKATHKEVVRSPDPCGRLLRTLEKLDTGTAPVDAIVEECGEAAIAERLRDKGFASGCLLSSSGLPSHLATLSGLCLLRAGHAMHLFTSRLFRDLDKGEFENNWTQFLRDLMSEEGGYESSRLSINMPPASLSLSPLQVIDFITLSYQVDGPMRLVITEAVLEKYQDLFQMFLRLKWCLYVLWTLRFRGVRDDSVLVRRVFSLRTWLLHTVSTVYSYFIHVPVGLEKQLERACQTSRDIRSIAEAHENVVEEWRRNCFLTENHPCQSVVQKLCGLAEGLRLVHGALTRGVPITGAGIESLETTYQEVVQGLAHYLALPASPRNPAFGLFHDEILCNLPESWDQ